MNTIKIFQTTPRIIKGIGALSNLGAELIRLGRSRVLVITDPGIVKAGLLAQLTTILTENKVEFAVFEQVEPDPQLQTALNARDAIRAANADVVVAIGGGSPIDIAKVAAVLATNDRDIGEMVGIDQVEKPGIPTITIPTTAGTGSEVTPIAILSDHTDKLKKGIVSHYLFPAVALLDAKLTVGLPPQVTAATGMDALIHAIEAFTSKNADSFTDVLAGQAMRLLYSHIREVYTHGDNLESRLAMLEGSMLAGMAFANAGVTAVHAFAYPIGAEFHIPHGVANSIMLVPVMEFNMRSMLERFATIADFFGLESDAGDTREKAQKVLDALRKLSEDLQIPKHLGEFGISKDDLPGLAQGVMQVTRLLANNPREMTASDAEEIYRKVL